MGGSTHMGGVGMVKQRWVWYHTLSMAGKTLPSPYRYCRHPSRRRRHRALLSLLLLLLSCVIVVMRCHRCRGVSSLWFLVSSWRPRVFVGALVLVFAGVFV